MEDIVDFLKTYSKGTRQRDWNQYSARTVRFSYAEADIAKWNEIYLAVRSSKMATIRRTPSGGINKSFPLNNYAYDVRPTRTSVTLTIIVGGTIWVFKVVPPQVADEECGMSGAEAFLRFKEELAKDGIDLESYAISPEEGLAEKAKLKDKVCIQSYHNDQVFDNVNHIDFHNSYPSGLAKRHPEMRPTIERLYEGRKEHPENKLVMNASIGYMQSKWCRYRFARLAREAIDNNYYNVQQLATDLESAGRKVLAINTDGIWYQGDPFHGRGEGPGLGQWANDHVNCRFRSKSAGAYEYIEDGKYTPVVRGVLKETQAGWGWGDIYSEHAQPKMLKFDAERGIIRI